MRTKNLTEICPNETSRPWDQQLTTSGCTENSGMIATRRSAHLATGVDIHWIHFKQCNPPIWILLSLIVDGCHFSLAFWIQINSVFWMETILMISITSLQWRLALTSPLGTTTRSPPSLHSMHFSQALMAELQMIVSRFTSWMFCTRYSWKARSQGNHVGLRKHTEFCIKLGVKTGTSIGTVLEVSCCDRSCKAARHSLAFLGT